MYEQDHVNVLNVLHCQLLLEFFRLYYVMVLNSIVVFHSDVVDLVVFLMIENVVIVLVLHVLVVCLFYWQIDLMYIVVDQFVVVDLVLHVVDLVHIEEVVVLLVLVNWQRLEVQVIEIEQHLHKIVLVDIVVVLVKIHLNYVVVITQI